MRSHVDIDDLAASVKYKRAFRKANPTYFEPDGILVFCGPQGSGKTLSAVRYVLDLLRAFPHAILCSNVKIYGLPDSVRYVQYTGLDCFDKYNTLSFRSVTKMAHGIFTALFRGFRPLSLFVPKLLHGVTRKRIR